MTSEYRQKKINFLSGLSFFLGFLDAFLIYILSEYFALASGVANVGAFYLVAFSIVLLSLFFLRPLVSAIGQARTLYLFLGLAILFSALLTRLDYSWFSVALAVGFVAIVNLNWVTLDILVENFSLDGSSGRIRGMYLTIMNAGLLAAPFLSTATLEGFRYEGVFFVLLIGYIVLFMAALLGLRNDNRVTVAPLSVRATWQKMKGESNLRAIYRISFAMEFFYALTIVYMPLYLRSLGFEWSAIGAIFTIMLLPFIFLQYPLGRLADKRFGEKEMLLSCLVIALLSTLVIPFVSQPVFWLWATILFCTRVGIAGIEVLRDSYFFKQVDVQDLDIIAFFRTTRPAANILAGLLGLIVLHFLPLSSIFFVIALVFIMVLPSAWRLRDSQSERERGVAQAAGAPGKS